MKTDLEKMKSLYDDIGIIYFEEQEADSVYLVPCNKEEKEQGLSIEVRESVSFYEFNLKGKLVSY